MVGRQLDKDLLPNQLLRTASTQAIRELLIRPNTARFGIVYVPESILYPGGKTRPGSTAREMASSIWERRLFTGDEKTIYEGMLQDIHLTAGEVTFHPQSERKASRDAATRKGIVRLHFTNAAVIDTEVRTLRAYEGIGAPQDTTYAWMDLATVVGSPDVIYSNDTSSEITSVTHARIANDITAGYVRSFLPTHKPEQRPSEAGLYGVVHSPPEEDRVTSEYWF